MCIFFFMNIIIKYLFYGVYYGECIELILFKNLFYKNY